MSQSHMPSVMVVEDERVVAKDLQLTLRALGYDVFAIAASAEEAVARAAERCPDLVLMDIRIDGKLDGIAAAELLKSQFDVAIVYVTAYADDETLGRAKLTEPYGYLVKPVQTAELRSAIEIGLHRHAVAKAHRERARATFEAPSSGVARAMFQQTLGAVVVFRDVSEPKRSATQHELVNQLALLGHRVASVVQDVNNPLSVISINAQYAAEALERHRAQFRADAGIQALRRELDEIASALADVTAAAERIDWLMTDLSVLSRVGPALAAQAHESQARAKVLVVDDEPLMLRLIRRVLEEHDVVATNDQHEALACLDRGEHFDLVLIDLGLPRNAGVRLYEQMLERDAALGRRIVFLYDGTISPMSDALLQRAGNFHIEKPFETSALREIARAFAATHGVTVH